MGAGSSSLADTLVAYTSSAEDALAQALRKGACSEAFAQAVQLLETLEVAPVQDDALVYECLLSHSEQTSHQALCEGESRKLFLTAQRCF